MTRKVLVVAAHSDDEALGCGGTMARHALQGDEVRVVFLTDGIGARSPGAEDRAASAARRAAAGKASEILGVSSVTAFDFPDNRLDSVPLLDVVQAIESAAKEAPPEIVYTHHSGDLNIDHRVCHQAVLTAFRAFPGQSVHTIAGFEVCSSTEWAFGSLMPSFLPSRYVDIAETIESKIAALDAYEAEMRPFPHVRSLEAVRALARWRGACVGLAAAEAFTLIREVI